MFAGSRLLLPVPIYFITNYSTGSHGSRPRPTRHSRHLPGHFRALHASFCWQALWRCWFHFPAGLGICPHCQRYQKLVQWPWYYCLIGHRTHLTWTPENLWETPDPTMQMTWRLLSKQPGLHYTWAVTQTDCLHATPHWRQPFGASHIVQNQCFYFSLIVFLIVLIFRVFYGTKLHLCIYLCINYIYCLLTTISLHEISNLNCC